MVRRVAAVAFILILAASSSASACLLLNEIYPNPDGTNNEWVELYNNCSTSVNLSEFIVTDNVSPHFYGLYGEVEAKSFVVVANNASLVSGAVAPNATVVNLGIGINWLNKPGDSVFLLNGSALSDSVAFGAIGDENSWSLCNGSWTETGNATPGMPNDCPKPTEPVNETNTTEDNMTDNITYEFTLSDMKLTVADNNYTARFGDVEYIECNLFTNGTPATLRIVAYINRNNDNDKQKWITKDKKGNTITRHFNESDTALILETSSTMQMVALQVPIMLKDNCNNEYADGKYRGFVRVYQDVTGNEIPHGEFNITVQGNNDAFCCEECPKCKKCECSCPGTSLPESSGSGIIELLGFDESVEAGEAFETAVRVKNTGTNNTSFAIYSYGYQGSRCLTYGLSNGTWSKGWTGNAQSFSLGPGSYREIRLVNAFDNSTESGVYSFRVRVRHDGRQDDITRTVKVEAAKVEHEENKSGRDVEIVFEDAENTSNANTDGITGMATSEGREVSGLGSIYESFLRWLALVFKF